MKRRRENFHVAVKTEYSICGDFNVETGRRNVAGNWRAKPSHGALDKTYARLRVFCPHGRSPRRATGLL